MDGMNYIGGGAADSFNPGRDGHHRVSAWVGQANSWKGPEEVLHRRGLWGQGGLSLRQDALNQSPPVGRVPDSAAPVGAI